MTDKWAGEDEDTDVRVKDNWDDDDVDAKDNWDDEDNEKTKSGVGDGKAVQRPKTKRLAKLKEKEKEEEEELNQEQLAARKIQEQKQREAQEIQIVKEAFGSSAICDSDPVTKDDFDALRKRIVSELLPFEKRAPYQDFLEDLIQDLALSLPSKRLKKVKTSVEALCFEKTKAEKVAKGPVGKAPKAKVKLHVENDRTVLKGGMDDDLDDYDDFM